MDSYPGGSSDWTSMLQMLKSDDEMLCYQGAMELRDALSYAQENQMHGFATEQYMDILVKIVNRDALTDLSNEVKFFAVSCLTTLMDIFPSLVNSLVNTGLLKGMTQLMQNTMGFIDLAEACIKAYEKIALENPSAVLKSGAIGCVLQQMDFFEVGTQQRIFRIIQRVARHSTCESDFDTYLLPVLPFIVMSLSVDQCDQKKSEDISKILFEIQESFQLYFSTVHDFQRVSLQYDKLNDFGVFEIVLECLKQFFEKRNKAKDEVQIDSGHQLLTQQTVLNFLRLLHNAASFSVKVANKIFGQSTLLRDVTSLLPQDARQTHHENFQEDVPLMLETINLLHSIFASKIEESNEQSKNIDKDKERRQTEDQKRDFQLSPENRTALAGVAENLLPRIFQVYEASINPQFRIKTLQVIDRVIALLDNELLRNFIEPKQVANFVFQIIKTKHSQSICVALQMTRKVLDSHPMTYAVPLIREGVSQLIANISTEQQFKAFLGISANTDVTDRSFDLDIHEVKEALHFARTSNPDDHAMRDFYERKLLELVEKQKRGTGSASKKKGVVSATDQTGTEEGPNLAVRIMGQAQALLADYFENKTFLADLNAHSPSTKLQLSLFGELTQLSRELCSEATQVQQTPAELARVRGVLGRICELLTLEDCAITCFEFKQSNLLWALELLLTKSPSQARVALEKRRARDSGEEMKRAEEIDLLEAQRQSKQLSKRESRCLILRLKHVAHVFLGSSSARAGSSPLRALIELNQRVISENDSSLAGGNSQGGPFGSFGGHVPSGFAREMGLSGMFGAGGAGSYGDYDHCISALRQLQRRVTVNLIYDSKRQLLKQGRDISGGVAMQMQPKSSGEEHNGLECPDVVDSQMEEASNDIQEKDSTKLTPKPIQRKGQSHHPAMMNLAGSPQKDGGASVLERQKMNASKVYLKRHSLYSELGQIPVTVEQSSCLQILEDFLRNRVKTAEQVKSLKFDYGLGAFGGSGPPGNSSAGASGSLFGGALHGQYQSITQKILQKSLGNGARKLLDSANERLTKILNTNNAFHIKVKRKQPKSRIQEGGMEDINEGQKSESEEENQSEGYGEMEEDEDEEQEMAAEIERQRLLDIFVEELVDQILDSAIPEDQQQILVKVLTRQHAFMVDQLKMHIDETVNGEAGIDDIASARQEEMYRLEERLEDFQETMERVQARYQDKLAERRTKKQPESKEEVKQGSEQPTKTQTGISFGEKDRDHEMMDESEDAGGTSPHPNDSEAKLKQSFTGSALKDDVEMMKPIDAKEGDSDAQEVEKKIEQVRKQNLAELLESEFAEEDERLEWALEREQHLQEKLDGMKQTLAEKGAAESHNEMSEQTQEVLAHDLDELIKQHGEDIDFEFFYEGKPILSHQSMFEIIKDSEARLRQAERMIPKAEQVRALQAKEEELKKKARRIADAKGASSQDEIAELRRETDKLKEMLHQISSQFGAMRGGSHGFLAGLNAHKIYFCIKDKADEVADLKRQRLDSLAELTNSALKRSRTKSEAVKEISSGSINEFVQQLLDKEFKVFEDEVGAADDESASNRLAKIDEEMADEGVVESSTEPRQVEASKESRAKKSGDVEFEQLGQSLKILKVLNYLCSHQDLISDRGIRLIMKGSALAEEGGDDALTGLPTKHAEAGFSDLDLQAGFAEIQPSTFHHHKLDSYLQRSIKDPYNLVQGAISPRMQQIFQNCPFLFPFSTKQLYFRLVSFISAVDVHRSIYFLRQYLKQSGAPKLPSHEKDNLKKIAKQKVLIHRDKLIPSAFSLIQKIDKRSFLEFEFQGEEGVGLGPTLEFYDNIAEEFRKWSAPLKNGKHHYMWRVCADNMLFPQPVCLRSLPTEAIKQIYEIFRLCGTIVAKAIVDDRQIDLPISPLFWRLCIGSQMSIFDLQKLDDSVFRTLAEFQIVANRAAEIEKEAIAKKLSEEVKNRQLQSVTIANGSRVEDYALAFTLPGYDEIELVQGGKDRDVVLENAQDYVDMVLHFTFHETVKLQVQAFKKGFNAIFPISSLAPFAHSGSQEGELETMVCGIKCNDAEWQNKEELMQNIEPDHGYTRQSDQYLHFIRYIMELEAGRRPAFLKFLTGSKRLPLGGFKGLSPHLTLVLKRENPGQQPDSILPSVMACQNYVKSPRYTSFEVFKARFDYAVQEGQQNFSLS